MEERLVAQRVRRGSLLLSKGPRRPSEVSAVGSEPDVVADAWTEHATAEGATYYFNAMTRKTTWDTPTGFALKSRKASVEDEHKEWAWVRDEVACFAPASRVEGTTDQFKTLDGRVVVARDQDVIAPIRDVSTLKRDMDDMVKMEAINEASVLHNLRLRAERDDYFTNVGTILVSVNPFKWLDHLYTREHFDRYRQRHAAEEVPPHFFEISDNAYRGLREEHRAQCIIISGESGAGKTEATKKCLQYIADVAGSDFGLESKLLATNPILEAFGNAKTVRNSNSSRFGKWTTVRFDAKGRICAGGIVNYLLEKSRVAVQMPGERNYHIFYQLVKGASEEQRARFRVPKSCGGLNFLGRSGAEADIGGVDDRACFQETMQALEELGFSEQQQSDLFRVTAGVLWLGNLEFETPAGDSRDDPCVLKQPASDHAIACVCELLGLDSEALLGNVMNRIRTMGGQVIRSPLSAQAAADSCASLAKELYGRLFDWLVTRVNATLAQTGNAGGEDRLIGVLDIFGFEIFEHNSFEQLCINFTNEKLQQHFNDHTFKTEQKVYEAEGIAFDPPAFEDNADVLSLLEARPQGLFVLLDEECVLPRGSDASFVSKITQYHGQGNSRFLSGAKARSKNQHAFAVRHYAGLVVYTADGFLEKNKDDLRENLVELASGSSMPFLCDELFAERDAAAEEGPGTPRSRRRHKTQAGFFRRQLDSLMATLRDADPHFIRCIKPNKKKSSDRFDAALCLEQLRYSGVFEAIEIRKQGFPFRRPHEAFFKRYRCLIAKPVVEGWTGDAASRCSSLLGALGELVKRKRKQPPVSPLAPPVHLADVAQCRLGRTMVLYRAPEHLTLESLREQKMDQVAVSITRVARGKLARMGMAAFLEIRDELRAAMATRDVDKIKQQLALCKLKVHAPYSLFHQTKEAEALLARIEEEKEVCRGVDELRELIRKDPNAAAAHYEDIEVVLEKAAALDIARNHPEFAEPLRDFEDRIASVRELIGARRALKEGIENGVEEVLVEAIKRAEALAETAGAFCDDDLRQAKDLLQRVLEEAPLVDAILAGLRNGGATGQVGALNRSAIHTQALRDAWTAAKAANKSPRGKLTPRALVFVEFAELVIALREGIRDRDWDAVEGLIARLDEMDSRGGLARFDVPREEVELYRGELNFSTIVFELSASVREGAVGGDPEALDTSCVAVDRLKTDIEDARVLGCPAATAKTVIRAAEHVLKLREAATISDWEGLADLVTASPLDELDPSDEFASTFLEACEGEVKLIQKGCLARRVVEMAGEAFGKGNIAGAVGDLRLGSAATTSLDAVVAFVDEHPLLQGQCPAGRSADTLALVRALQALRAQLLKEGTPPFEAAQEALSLAKRARAPDAAVKEIELIRSELAERVAIAELEKGAAQGQAGGKVGALDLGEMSVAPLEAALASAKRIWKEAGMDNGAESKAGARLAAAVPELCKLRASLAVGDWDTVDDVIANSPTLHTPATSREITLVQEELSNRMIIAELTKSLSSGALSGPVGELDTAAIEVAALRDDIHDAKELGCKTKEAKQLLESAELVLELREAVLAVDWQAVNKIVDQARFQRVLEVAKRDVDRAEQELKDRRILHALRHALENGGATGSLDSLRVDTITFHVLDEALALAQELRCQSKRAQALYSAARTVRDGRAAMSQARFAQLGPLVEDAERHGLLLVEGQDAGQDEQKRAFAEPALAELEMMRAKYEDECMKEALAGALAEGRATGRIGDLDLSSVKLGPLLKAVDKYSLAEPRTQRARQLLTVAGIIARLREALLAGPDWEEVGKVAAELTPRAMVEAHGFDLVAEVEEEVRLVHDEIEHRQVVRLLETGLEKGPVRGSIGALDLSELSVETLNDSIERVKKLARKTPESKQLFVTAEVVRDVRLCVLAVKDHYRQADPAAKGSPRGASVEAKWLGSVQVALDRAHGVGVAACAKEEVQLVQNHVDDVKIVKELCAALSQGQVNGPVGRSDARSCDKQRVVTAISCAQSLVCKTERARKLERTAKTVLRLREVLLDDGWAALGPVLEKELGVSVEGGTPPDSFVGFCDEGVAEFQRLIDECRDRGVRQALERAMGEGAMSGQPGRLALGGLRVDELAHALAFAGRAAAHLSKETRDVVRAAQALHAIREAVRHGGDQSEDVQVVAATLAALPALEMVGHYKVPEGVRAELELARDHANDVRIMELLAGAVTPRKPADAASLRAALKTVEASLGGPRSERAREAVAAVDLLASLRTALQQRDFDAIRKALAEAIECAGIALLPGAEDEIYAARSLVVNHDTVETLASGLVQGSILELSETPAEVDCAALEEAAKEAGRQVAGEFDPLVSGLLDRCALLCELRQAFRLVAQDSWAAVETSLAKIANLDARQLVSTSDTGDEQLQRDKEDNGGASPNKVESDHQELVIATQRRITAEVQHVREMFEDRQVLHMLQEAMSEGHLGGAVGSVSTALLKVAPLELAVDAAVAAQRLSSRTQAALRHARHVLAVRQAVLQGDWHEAYRVLKKARDTLGVSDSHRPEGVEVAERDEAAVNATCLTPEMKLIWEEAKRRVVAGELEMALRTGGVEGVPGALSTHRVSVALLNKAIAQAVEINVKTDDCRELLLAAHTVRQIRNGILASTEEGGGSGHVDCVMVRDALRICEQDGLEKLPMVARPEIGLVKAELEDQDAAKTLSEALRKHDALDDAGQAAAVEALTQALSKTQEEQCHTVFARALHKLAQLMRRLRTAVLETSWEEAAACIHTVDDLRARVRQGDAPVSTQESHNQQWRAALLLVQAEVGQARDHIENSRTVAKLREAMLTGQAPGKFGYMRLDRLELGRLDEALSHAVAVGCKTEEATVLYKTARLLRQLRCALLDEDFVTASVIVSEATALTKTLDAGGTKATFHRLPVAGDEFEMLSHEIDNKLVCRTLRAALKAGAVTGKVGAVTVTESNVSGLEKAMAKAHGLKKVSEETQALVHSAQAVLKLRQILVEAPAHVQHTQNGNGELQLVSSVRMWEAAQNVIASAVATAPTGGFGGSGSSSGVDEVSTASRASSSNGMSNGNGVGGALVVANGHSGSHTPRRAHDMGQLSEQQVKSFNLLWCHHDAREELILLLDEIQHREAVQQLLIALASGSAKFLGGFVDVSAVKTGMLQAAIANAKKVPTRTEEITSLQLSATIILRCREALMDGSWQDLRQLLLEASEVRVHEAAADEVNLLQREMHLHSVIKAVLLNIQQASASRDVQALESALREADTLRLSSSPDLHVLARVNKARQLLDRLVVLEDRLQQAAKRCDLHALQLALEEAQKLQYKPDVAVHAERMRNRLTGLFQEADRAIDEVDAGALRTLLERSAEEGVALPRADEMRRILACPPRQLERLRLNSAIERGDEETVVEVTMKIKSRFFEDEVMRERHRLEYFPGLKSADEFAANTGVIASSLASGMLSHSSTPIPTSLTRLPSTPATALAVKVFRALLGYCGDRHYSYPASLAQEVLQVGLAVAELRDEIFLQIIKQLTENPSQTSQERGRVLLGLCFETFPPSEEFENFLELWLRRKAVEQRGGGSLPFGGPAGGSWAGDQWAAQCLNAMHRVVFRGPAVTVPDLEPVHCILRADAGRRGPRRGGATSGRD